MVRQFTATVVGVDAGPDHLVVDVATADQAEHVLFQRDISGNSWGIHFELSEQGAAGYDRIRAVSLSRDQLRIELSGPLDNGEDVRAVEVALHVSEEEHDSLRRGLMDVLGSGPGSLLTLEALAG